MPYEQKRVKSGNHPGRDNARDTFFTNQEKQAPAPAPFFTKKDTDKEDAPVQGQFMQPKAAAGPAAKPHNASPPKKNDTGLPDDLKAGMEELSGFSLDDVNVHYNSDRPAQLKAYAYTQGKDIHVGQGQERHLPHEAWHVVQQKQGRVNATMQMKGFNINDDEGLEKEADVMGRQAKQQGALDGGEERQRKHVPLASAKGTVQRLIGFEVETNIPVYHNAVEGDAMVHPDYRKGFTAGVRNFLFGGLKYGAQYGFDPEGHFTLTADHNALQRAHNKIIQLLLLSGFLKPDIRHRSMANLEYVTTARDELSTGARQLSQEDISKVRIHVERTLGLARGGESVVVPESGDWMLTGIPKKELLTWIAAHNGDVSLLDSALGEMEALMTNKLYVQQTTGVLPRDMPELFGKAGERMRGDDKKISGIMADFLQAAILIGQQTYEGAGNTLPPSFGTHNKAVIGYLTFLASYLLADSLSLTTILGKSATTKNLFPYFPKVSLSTGFKALPDALQGEKEAWKVLLNILCEKSLVYGLKYWEAKGLVIDKDTFNTKIFGEITPLLNIDTDEKEDSSSQFKHTEAKKKFDQLIKGEKVLVGGESNLPGDKLDKPHKEVAEATGEQAIPVEDRFWGSKFSKEITTENIEAAITGEVETSMKRQLTHVHPDKRGKIEEDISSQPDRQGMQQQRIKSKTATLENAPGDILERVKESMKDREQSKEIAEKKEREAIEIESQTIPKVAKSMELLETASALMQSLQKRYKELGDERKKLVPEQESEKTIPDKEPDPRLKKLETDIDDVKKEYRQALIQQKALLLSIETDVGVAVGDIKKAKLEFVKLQRKPVSLRYQVKQELIKIDKALQEERELTELAEQVRKFSPPPGSKPPEPKALEEGAPIEKDLNRSIHAQNALANTWYNKLNDEDTPYTFEDAKNTLEYEAKIRLAKEKKKVIDVEQLKEDKDKREIAEMLKSVEELEMIISAYDGLTRDKTSPKEGGLLFKYLQVAGKYSEIMGMAYDAYKRADKKQEVKQ